MGSGEQFGSRDVNRREPSPPSAVEEQVRHQRGASGSPPGPRFTEEERRRLADFFILLDQMDRAHSARRERKAA